MAITESTCGCGTRAVGDCEVGVNPPLHFSPCSKPHIQRGGITKVYILTPGGPPVDFSDINNELASRVDNAGDSAADNSIIRELILRRGTKGAPSDTTEDLGDCYGEIVTEREHSIEFSIVDTNKATIEWMRQIQCQSGTQFPVLYVTKSCMIWGCNDGLPSTINLQFIIGDSGTVQEITGTITFNQLSEPECECYTSDPCKPLDGIEQADPQSCVIEG